MINLTPEEIAEFKAIWKAEFGQVLTDEEASEQARRLIAFYQLLSRRLPEEE